MQSLTINNDNHMSNQCIRDFEPAIGRLALKSSGVIGLHWVEQNLASDGIGKASGRHREGSRRILKQRDFEGPRRSDIGKASGRHREIMIKHFCIEKSL